MRHEWDFRVGESLSATRARVASDTSLALEPAEAEDVVAHASALHGRGLAMVSSFGADSVVLLHMLAQVAPETPVLLLDTAFLFPETLDYQSELADNLGLTDISLIRADARMLRLADPDGALHQSYPDDCCHIRKTLPLELALAGFEASITGRKRYQTAMRARMQVAETDPAGRYRYNPLANWQAADVAAYMRTHELPSHPLVAKGYRSIGCVPCTSPVDADEDPRAGRWRGQAKTECGIHFGAHGITRNQSA